MDPFWDGASCAATKEFPSVLCKLRFHCLFQKSPPTGCYTEPDNSAHTILFHLCISHFKIIIHLHFGLLSGHFPFGFPTKILYSFLISPIESVSSYGQPARGSPLAVLFGWGITIPHCKNGACHEMGCLVDCNFIYLFDNVFTYLSMYLFIHLIIYLLTNILFINLFILLHLH